MNELETTIDKIKKSIDRNNKNNFTGRRRYTKKNKKDILEFIQKFELNFNQASDLLSISGNSLKRWHDQSLPKEFKQVSVSKKTEKRAKSERPQVESGKRFDQLQVTLLVLQALLIIERIFVQLIF